MIKIIAIGKIKEKFYRDAIEEYLKRLKKYEKIEIIELKDETSASSKENLKKEATLILSKIDDKDYVIALDRKAKDLSSKDFALTLSKISLESSKITFVIGGSEGLAKEVLDRSNQKISFSKLTFPHQLFRVILLEQIYRAYRINNNEKYHK